MARPACPRATVAQLVEQLTRNEQVSGSNPLGGSIAIFDHRRLSGSTSGPRSGVSSSACHKGMGWGLYTPFCSTDDQYGTTISLV